MKIPVRATVEEMQEGPAFSARVHEASKLQPGDVVRIDTESCTLVIERKHDGGVEQREGGKKMGRPKSKVDKETAAEIQRLKGAPHNMTSGQIAMEMGLELSLVNANWGTPPKRQK